MAGYIGTKASVVSSGSERKKTYSITTTTTSLTGLAYTPGQVHVFHNGVRLVDNTDYTATNGTSITLTTAAQAGDEIVVLSSSSFQVSDTVSASNGGTFANPVTIDGNSATVLTVDRATSDGTIIDLQKNGSSVGSVGTLGGVTYMNSGDVGFSLDWGSDQIKPRQANGANRDAAIDLGASASRWKNLYLSGGVYLGGTGAANYLDDYEEGTFTPGISFGGGSVGVTYSTRQGYYLKIGKIVYVTIVMVVTNKGSSTGDAYLTGLPFTVGNGLTQTAIEGGGIFTYFTNLSQNVSGLTLAGQDGTTTAGLRALPASGTTVSNLTENFINNGFDTRIFLTYNAA